MIWQSGNVRDPLNVVIKHTRAISECTFREKII